ncbi:MAG: helix-turn-helix domain-containing protein [Spirochaetaceae bacterium]|jgi:transcriptional regulator with XRE-family HTH domain|nr:helix-turn-helix domain-containing protein [Spirochaetaceae bacterium]
MTEKELLYIMSRNIKAYREGLKLTQANLAEIIDVSIAFLSAIECGRKWPSPKTMIKIAKALKVEPYELFRPRDKLPDDVVKTLDNYTRDIVEAVCALKTAYKDEYSACLQKALKNRADGRN